MPFLQSFSTANAPLRLLRLGGLLAAVVLALLLVSCARAPTDRVGLLAGRSPSRVDGVVHPERITDGLAPPVGTAWNTNRTAVFERQTAVVEYDLGAEVPIGAAFLLGDNNDDYEVLLSSDGKRFLRAWQAKRVSEPGVRWRESRTLAKTARYVRLTVRSGDRGLSVGEFALFSQSPAGFPQLTTVMAEDGTLDFRHHLLLFATAALVAVTLASSSAGLAWNLTLMGVFLLGLLQFAQSLRESFPVGQLEVSLTRGVSAIIALGVVAREAFAPAHLRAFAPLNLAALVVSAALSLACFFNLGSPQFYDAKAQQPSVVHNYDMRVYFPVAKYFEELRYDGLYLASVLSYAEEHDGLQARQIQETELRDLRDHRMRKVREVMPEVQAIRARFSTPRWAEFKKDMAYFWDTMGTGGYLGSMRDHGGNATPLWLTIAYLMFHSARASNEVLLLGGALDPLLLLLFGLCTWRAFGARTALVALVVYGANDFYMFGSNWAGATLRNDWMVYLGLGACALKTERFRLAGAMLAFSALIRAFPAISLLALGLPVAYYLLGEVRQFGRLPNWRRVMVEQRWFFDCVLGAAVFVALSVALSSIVLGWESWPLWVKKISSFTASPHVNHISLLTVTSGSEGIQNAVLRQRLPLHIGATAMFLGLAAWASYKRPPHAAALLGILMMPVLMYPANYYIHFVFLLPLLVDEPLRALDRAGREVSGKLWVIVLGLCTAQYFTVKEQALDLHFYNASVLLMVATLLVLLVLLPRDESGELFLPFKAWAQPASGPTVDVEPELPELPVAEPEVTSEVTSEGDGR